MAGSGHVIWVIGLYVVTLIVYVVEVFLATVNGLNAVGKSLHQTFLERKVDQRLSDPFRSTFHKISVSSVSGLPL